MVNIRKIIRVGIAVTLCLLIFAPGKGVAEGAISQAYATRSDTIPGALLSFTSDGSSVEPAKNSQTANLAGVASNSALIELSAQGTGTVQTVTSGVTQTLVSDLNGQIKTGDKIAASPVAGVGMKALSSTQIVGVAQSDFDTTQAVEKTVTGQDGKPTTIKVGLLPVAVNITYYVTQPESRDGAASLVPPFLQTLANALSGREVSPLRVLLGTAVIVLSFATITTMLYSSIRSSMTSIGRNPLAGGALRKGVVDVSFAALGILAATVAIVYIILST